MAKTVTAGTYTRVSTEEQATEDKVSLAVQREKAEAYCTAQGWEVAEVYVDAGVSGAKTDRPALQRMLADARAGKFERVVFLKSDRLARKTRLLLNVWEELEAAGIGIASVEEGFDTSTAAGRLAHTMLAAAAEFERENIRERVRMGKHAMARRGLFPCGIPPYGYRYDPDTRKLVVDDGEAAVIRRIFSLYIDEGLSIRAIARKLNEEHVPTRGLSIRSPDGRRKGWLAPQLARILKSPTYKGRWEYGRRKTGSDGKRRRSDKDAAITVEVPALVSEGLWDLARKKAAGNKHYGRGHERSLFYMLRGILYCDECGRPFKALGTPVGAVRRDQRGHEFIVRTEYRGYACRGQDQHPHVYNCRRPKFMRAEMVEGPVWEAVAQALRDPYLLREAATARLGELQSAGDQSDGLIAKRRRQIAQAARERDGAVSLASRGDITADDLRIRLERLDADMATWEEELNRLVRAADWRAQAEEVTRLLEDFCRDVGPTLDALTKEERRELLLALVDKVWLDGQGNIRIEGVIPSLPQDGNTAVRVDTAATRAAMAAVARSQRRTRRRRLTSHKRGSATSRQVRCRRRPACIRRGCAFCCGPFRR